MGFFGKFFSSPAVSVRADNARFSVIDTETTGLDPHNGDRIIELAAVTFDSRFNELDRWESLIRPGETPVLNSALHGITNEMLDTAPVFGTVYRSFANFIDGTVLIAHNAPFDAGLLDAEITRIRPHSADTVELPFVDSIALARQQLPHGPYRLSALLERMGLENPHAHSAAADAAATGAMLSALFGDNIDGLSRELQKMPVFSCMHTSQWGLPYGRPMPRE